MRTRLALSLLLLIAAGPAWARHGQRHRPSSTVVVDGTPSAVRWLDGDTFRFLDGALRGLSARLAGYNTLESYGPVHRWGGWSREELLRLARAATLVAASGSWTCANAGGVDRYKRLLVSCPGAATALVSRGLAMVYAVDAPADARLLAHQREAQRRREGMWAKGVPPAIPTSLHSAAENPRGSAYDRVVDTATGAAVRREHKRVYATCEEVCFGGGAARACMVYVRFEQRYRHRPRCLLP